MCLGCVCTKLFSSPYGHVMLADLYQVAALRFYLDSCVMEGILVLFLWLDLGRNLWKKTGNIVTMAIMYFDVECQEMLTPSTDLKGDGTNKILFWRLVYMTAQKLSFSW